MKLILTLLAYLYPISAIKIPSFNMLRAANLVSVADSPIRNGTANVDPLPIPMPNPIPAELPAELPPMPIDMSAEMPPIPNPMPNPSPNVAPLPMLLCPLCPLRPLSLLLLMPNGDGDIAAGLVSGV